MIYKYVINSDIHNADHYVKPKNKYKIQEEIVKHFNNLFEDIKSNSGHCNGCNWCCQGGDEHAEAMHNLNESTPTDMIDWYTEYLACDYYNDCALYKTIGTIQIYKITFNDDATSEKELLWQLCDDNFIEFAKTQTIDCLNEIK